MNAALGRSPESFGGRTSLWAVRKFASRLTTFPGRNWGRQFPMEFMICRTTKGSSASETAEYHGSRNHIHKFADIARPVIVLQSLHRHFINAARLASGLLNRHLQIVFGKQRNIADSITQRRLSQQLKKWQDPLTAISGLLRFTAPVT